jgi:hypothetical protein
MRPGRVCSIWLLSPACSQRVVCTMGCAHDNCCWLLLLEFMEAAQKLGGDCLAWLSLPMELLVPAWFNSCE